MPVYLPTMAMVTAPSGLRTRSLMTFQLCSAGGIFGADAEGGQHLVVEAGGVIGLRHRIDVVDVPRLDHGAFAHVAEQAELAPLFLRVSRSVRHSRISGWMPIERSSFTECWVGLVFNSPALGMNGNSVK